MGFRATKERVVALLEGDAPLPELLSQLAGLPRSQVLKALFAALCHHEEKRRWRAIAAFGPVVAGLADEDLEAARVVMRRLMWSLNDESGGIGWGVPEAMAECLVHHDDLAAEYTHILVSFMREDGFFLEYPPLQRGLMWGLGRLAAVRPQLLRQKGAPRYLPAYLASPDPAVRGLAAHALGLLGETAAREQLQPLLDQGETFPFHQDGQLYTRTVGQMAADALARL